MTIEVNVTPVRRDIRSILFSLIDDERDYQDNKWGTHSQPLSHYLLVLHNELAEANLGWMKNLKGRDSATREILQVAAVAVAALENHYEELYSNMELNNDN